MEECSEMKKIKVENKATDVGLLDKVECVCWERGWLGRQVTGCEGKC